MPEEQRDVRPTREGEREEDRQSPLVHEGAAPDAGYSTNERADGRVRIENPDGEEVPSPEPSSGYTAGITGPPEENR